MVIRRVLDYIRKLSLKVASNTLATFLSTMITEAGHSIQMSRSVVI